MDIGHVNSLLSEVRARLEYLDPQFEDVEMQQDDPSDSENQGARMANVKKRLAHLLAKLGANRSDANHVRAYGTK
jgi:hypothetical protein